MARIRKHRYVKIFLITISSIKDDVSAATIYETLKQAGIDANITLIKYWKTASND